VGTVGAEYSRAETANTARSFTELLGEVAASVLGFSRVLSGLQQSSVFSGMLQREPSSWQHSIAAESPGWPPQRSPLKDVPTSTRLKR
jgi:hypothetical protein